MAAFVLDASIAVSWCFPGDPAEDTPYSRHILGLLATYDAVVPEIWAFEIANSIFVSFNKRKRITEKTDWGIPAPLEGVADSFGARRFVVHR
jgi:hypothetical protein